MSRTLTQLKEEMLKNGLPLPQGKFGKEALEVALRDFYWNRDHQGETMPEQVEPMLARNIKDLDPKQAQAIWDSSEWIAQQKMDGIRNRTQVIGGKIRSFSRRISDKTYLYEENTAPMFWLNEIEGIPAEWEGAMLDGEVVSTIVNVDTTKFTKGGKGTVTSNRLTAVTSLVAIENTREAQEAHGMPLRYIVYDCIRGKNGEDLRQKSYLERMAVAKEFVEMLQSLGCDKVQLLPWITENKYQYYVDQVNAGAEGVMLKKIHSPYQDGTRSKFMYKAKRFIEVDGFVSGWVPAQSGSAYEKEGLVGGLEISAYDVNTGKPHVIASVSNITLEERRKISLHNPDGTFKDITPETYGRIFEIRGQEWSSKIFALKHATIERERIGADGKNQQECVFDLEAVKREIAEAKAGI